MDDTFDEVIVSDTGDITFRKTILPKAENLLRRGKGDYYMLPFISVDKKSLISSSSTYGLLNFKNSVESLLTQFGIEISVLEESRKNNVDNLDYTIK